MERTPGGLKALNTPERVVAVLPEYEFALPSSRMVGILTAQTEFLVLTSNMETLFELLGETGMLPSRMVY
jgi:hypothetical protein